jgi:hypothetical protein
MLVAGEFAQHTLEQIKELCAGGTMTVYSVARPISPERAVDRSGLLATFTFQTPAFGDAKDGLEALLFVENMVPGHSVGTPGFARIRKADGTTTQTCRRVLALVRSSSRKYPAPTAHRSR